MKRWRVSLYSTDAERPRHVSASVIVMAPSEEGARAETERLYPLKMMGWTLTHFDGTAGEVVPAP